MEISIIQNLDYFILFIVPIFLFFFLIIFHKIVSNKYIVFLIHLLIFTLFLLLYINNRGPDIFMYLFLFQFLNFTIYLRNSKYDSSKLIKKYFFISISILLVVQINTNIYNSNKEYLESDRNYKVFFQSIDNFGDTIKLAVSFDFIFDRSEVKDIKGINQKFYQNNEYFLEHIKLICKDNMENPSCAKGFYKNTPRHYGLPPLYLSTVVIFGYILKFLNSVFLLMIFLSFLTIFIVYLTFRKYFFEKRFFYLFITLTSFPFYFAIQRANFVSVIVFVLLMNIFYKKYFENSFNFFELILLSLIINFRPNLILIAPLFVFEKNIVLFFKNSLKLGVLIFSVFFISFKYLTISIYNYSLDILVNNFILYADELLNQYIVEGAEGYNSSLYSFLLMFNESFAELLFNLGFSLENLNRSVINNFVFIILILICLYVYFLYSNNKLKFDESFIVLLISSLIISPKIADYYLTLLLIPLFLYLNLKELNRKKIMTLFFIFFVLLPKPHSFIVPVYGVSLGLFFNCLTLLFIIFFIIFERKNYTNDKRK